MKKLISLFVIVTTMITLAHATTFTFSDATSQTKDGITVSFAQGANENQNAPTYLDGLRLFAKNTITVSGGTITSISMEFTKQGKKDYATLSASVVGLVSGGVSTSNEDVKTDTWTGSASKVVFTFGSTGQRIIKSITVVGTGSTSDEGELEEEYVYSEPTVVENHDSTSINMAYSFIQNNIKVDCTKGARTGSYFSCNAGSSITFTATKNIKCLVINGYVKKGFEATATAGSIDYVDATEEEVTADPVLVITDINSKNITIDCVKQMCCYSVEFYFDANPQFSIITCIAENGTQTGAGIIFKGDICTLIITPNAGYQFTQWSDGNTDNPRTFVVTQDSTFTAQIDTLTAGQCGDYLYWHLVNDTLIITGNGEMYDYTESHLAEWYVSNRKIVQLVLPDGLTHIGNYAFANCSGLTSVTFPSSVTTIGNEAFAECSGLADIYCYAQIPPTCENTNAFDGVSEHCYIHVPTGTIRTYQFAKGWSRFYHFFEISEVPVGGTDQVGVEVTNNTAVFSWPVNPTASSYTLVIKKNEEVFCTLTFNSLGQLVGMAFAPARGANNDSSAQSTAYGYSFMVSNLDASSTYDYTFTAKDASNNVLTTTTGQFKTGGTATDLETVDGSQCTNSPVHQFTKYVKNGRLLIERNGILYNAHGARVK